MEIKKIDTNKKQYLDLLLFYLRRNIWIFWIAFQEKINC